MFRRLPGTTLFPYTTLFRSMPHRSPIRRGPAGRMAMDSDGIGATPLLMDGAGDHIPIGDAGPMPRGALHGEPRAAPSDRKSTRLNSSHLGISYAVFCLKKKR